MASQLRIYTINRGMMDSWLRLFEDHIRPLHSKYGMLVENTWVNADRTEFIWVLSFDAEEIEEKAAEYAASPERQALGDRPDSHVAKRELLVIEPVRTGPR